jgi:hypothetical protein
MVRPFHGLFYKFEKKGKGGNHRWIRTEKEGRNAAGAPGPLRRRLWRLRVCLAIAALQKEAERECGLAVRREVRGYILLSKQVKGLPQGGAIFFYRRNVL